MTPVRVLVLVVGGSLGRRSLGRGGFADSCPSSTPQWRLFLPKEWSSDTDRRALTRVPPEVTHREKWRLALDMLDTLATWGMTPPVVVADAAYGTNAQLRAGLADPGIGYVLAVRADVTAHPFDAEPESPERKGPLGCWPQPRYRHPAPSVAALTAGLGQEAFTSLTWRQGTRGELRSRFAALRVRPAGKAVERPIRAVASADQGWWDGILPDCWLLVEWPESADAPTDYWLSSLPKDTAIADLVRLAKVRWRIEHDYRELKHGLAWTTSKAVPGPAGTTMSPS